MNRNGRKKTKQAPALDSLLSTEYRTRSGRRVKKPERWNPNEATTEEIKDKTQEKFHMEGESYSKDLAKVSNNESSENFYSPKEKINPPATGDHITKSSIYEIKPDLTTEQIQHISITENSLTTEENKDEFDKFSNNLHSGQKVNPLIIEDQVLVDSISEDKPNLVVEPQIPLQNARFNFLVEESRCDSFDDSLNEPAPKVNKSSSPHLLAGQPHFSSRKYRERQRLCSNNLYDSLEDICSLMSNMEKISSTEGFQNGVNNPPDKSLVCDDSLLSEICVKNKDTDTDEQHFEDDSLAIIEYEKAFDDSLEEAELIEILNISHHNENGTSVSVEYVENRDSSISRNLFETTVEEPNEHMQNMHVMEKRKTLLKVENNCSHSTTDCNISRDSLESLNVCSSKSENISNEDVADKIKSVNSSSNLFPNHNDLNDSVKVSNASESSSFGLDVQKNAIQLEKTDEDLSKSMDNICIMEVKRAVQKVENGNSHSTSECNISRDSLNSSNVNSSKSDRLSNEVANEIKDSNSFPKSNDTNDILESSKVSLKSLPYLDIQTDAIPAEYSNFNRKSQPLDFKNNIPKDNAENNFNKSEVTTVNKLVSASHSICSEKCNAGKEKLLSFSSSEFSISLDENSHINSYENEELISSLKLGVMSDIKKGIEVSKKHNMSVELYKNASKVNHCISECNSEDKMNAIKLRHDETQSVADISMNKPLEFCKNVYSNLDLNTSNIDDNFFAVSAKRSINNDNINSNNESLLPVLNDSKSKETLPTLLTSVLNDRLENQERNETSLEKTNCIPHGDNDDNVKNLEFYTNTDFVISNKKPILPNDTSEVACKVLLSCSEHYITNNSNKSSDTLKMEEVIISENLASNSTVTPLHDNIVKNPELSETKQIKDGVETFEENTNSNKNLNSKYKENVLLENSANESRCSFPKIQIVSPEKLMTESIETNTVSTEIVYAEKKCSVIASEFKKSEIKANESSEKEIRYIEASAVESPKYIHLDMANNSNNDLSCENYVIFNTQGNLNVSTEDEKEIGKVTDADSLNNSLRKSYSKDVSYKENPFESEIISIIKVENITPDSSNTISVGESGFVNANNTICIDDSVCEIPYDKLTRKKSLPICNKEITIMSNPKLNANIDSTIYLDDSMCTTWDSHKCESALMCEEEVTMISNCATQKVSPELSIISEVNVNHTICLDDDSIYIPHQSQDIVKEETFEKSAENVTARTLTNVNETILIDDSIYLPYESNLIGDNQESENEDDTYYSCASEIETDKLKLPSDQKSDILYSNSFKQSSGDCIGDSTSDIGMTSRSVIIPSNLESEITEKVLEIANSKPSEENLVKLHVEVAVGNEGVNIISVSSALEESQNKVIGGDAILKTSKVSGKKMQEEKENVGRRNFKSKASNSVEHFHSPHLSKCQETKNSPKLLKRNIKQNLKKDTLSDDISTFNLKFQNRLPPPNAQLIQALDLHDTSISFIESRDLQSRDSILPLNLCLRDTPTQKNILKSKIESKENIPLCDIDVSTNKFQSLRTVMGADFSPQSGHQKLPKIFNHCTDLKKSATKIPVRKVNSASSPVILKTNSPMILKTSKSELKSKCNDELKCSVTKSPATLTPLHKDKLNAPLTMEGMKEKVPDITPMKTHHFCTVRNSITRVPKSVPRVCSKKFQNIQSPIAQYIRNKVVTPLQAVNRDIGVNSPIPVLPCYPATKTTGLHQMTTQKSCSKR